jgi:hypothetical protein
MATESAAPWQEIIAPAPPPADPWLLLAWLVAALALLALAAWLGLRWWRQPRRTARRRLAQIRRHLESGAITPRAGLYAAAACRPAPWCDDAARQMLAQRFARQEPDHQQVLELLRGLQGGPGR